MKLSEKTGGGLIYAPPMMQFDGASYYSKSGITASGNKVSVIARFRRLETDGDTYQVLSQFRSAASRDRFSIYCMDSGWSADARTSCVAVSVVNSAGTVVCELVSPTGYLDGQEHVLLFAYDGDAGTAVFYIDGQDADDTGNAARTAPTTGTLDTSMTLAVGASIAATVHFVGEISLFGCADAYLTNWQDFMDSQGNPKALDQFGWTQWGGGTFAPASQDFDGSTGYFSLGSVTTANNSYTAVARISGVAPSTDPQTIIRIGTANLRLFLEVMESDDANIPNVLRFRAWEQTTNTIICQVASNTVVTDGSDYLIFIAYDATAGTAIMRVNGVDDMDTGYVNHTITTGTLSTGSATVTVGANHSGALLLGGEIGFVGYKDAYLTNWGDFMDATGTPQEIDELNWTEWGGQPLFWHKYCALDDNQGSAGNMTRNGTVTHTPNSQPLFFHPAAKMDENEGEAGAMTENGTILLSDAGSQGLPMIGLPTNGDAVAADIAAGKTAFVDGLEVVGSMDEIPHDAIGGCLLLAENPLGSTIATAYDPRLDATAGGAIIIKDTGWSTLLGNAVWSLTTEGLASHASGYADFVRTASGPALGSGARKLENWGKLVATPANDTGAMIYFNVLDASTDWWSVGLRWIAASNLYRLIISERTASTTTNRSLTDFPTTVTGDAHYHLTAYFLGDRVVAAATIWEYGGADIQSHMATYNVASRPNKTETGIKISMAAGGTDAYIKGFKVSDLNA